MRVGAGFLLRWLARERTPQRWRILGPGGWTWTTHAFDALPQGKPVDSLGPMSVAVGAPTQTDRSMWSSRTSTLSRCPGNRRLGYPPECLDMGGVA